MKKIIIILGVILAACTPAAQNQLPTPYIAPSYPTVQSAPLANVQTNSGIQVTSNRAWRDGKEVNADVCFTLLDTSDWSVWAASLQYNGGSVTDFSSTMVNVQEPQNGQPGMRCDTLSFYNIPPDADLTSVTISVDSIAAPPRAEDYCTIYMPKIQQSLNDRGIGIVLGCVDSGGQQVMQIISKPDSMSQDEADQYVYSDEYYTIKGPWAFTFNLGQ